MQVLGRDVQGGFPALGEPEVTAAVEESHVGVTEQREHPQRIGGPPIALVAIDHHGVIAGDALAVHQFGELLAVDVVAHPWVVEVGVPVDLDGAGNMADVVEQDVLVGFDDRQARRAHVCRQPVGGHEPFGMGVGRQGGARVCGKRHIIEPTAGDLAQSEATAACALGRPHFLPTVRRRTARIAARATAATAGSSRSHSTDCPARRR